MAKTAIGIDLGTTYSCVAVWKNGRAEIIANDQGNRTTPSCVAFNDKERLIGDAAKSQIAFNPKNTVFDAKRLIGRKYNEALRSDLKHWPFEVIKENGKPCIVVTFRGAEKKLTPEEISSMVLGKMKEMAESFLGEKVKQAVITVPAYFNHAQRQATIDSGTVAGLNVLRIINEPTAAALAYCYNKIINVEKNILVYDLGGGTCDVSVLSMKDGSFEVKSTAGDTHLGGEDFDNRLVDYLLSEIQRKYGKDMRENPRALTRLKAAAERTKRTLSSSTEANIDIDALFDGIDFYMKISRARFEELCIDLFKLTIRLVAKALEDANLSKEDVDDVILVGGSSRIPKIQSLLEAFFDGKQLSHSINPEEAVAQGAAIQAAILSKTIDSVGDLQMVDVTPLSLGIETSGKTMSTIIEKNTKIPCTKRELFTTYTDNQPAVTIQVYEGERTITKYNNLLGKFDLTGIPPAPHGVPQIEVVFAIDANGLLKVSATDMQTKKQNSIRLCERNRLSSSDIARMICEAEKYKYIDAKQRKEIICRHDLECFVFHVENLVRDKQTTPLNDRDRTKLDKCVRNTLLWLEANPNATTEQYKIRKASFEAECQPFMSALNLKLHHLE